AHGARGVERRLALLLSGFLGEQLGQLRHPAPQAEALFHAPGEGRDFQVGVAVDHARHEDALALLHRDAGVRAAKRVGGAPSDGSPLPGDQHGRAGRRSGKSRLGGPEGLAAKELHAASSNRYVPSRRTGTNPASRMCRSMPAASIMKKEPAAETTFSSNMTWPKSLAPKWSAVCPTAGPMVGQEACRFSMLSRVRRATASMRRYSPAPCESPRSRRPPS